MSEVIEHTQMPHLNMSVNVSARQLMTPGFVEQVQSVIAETQIEPPDICGSNPTISCPVILSMIRASDLPRTGTAAAFISSPNGKLTIT